MPDAAPSRCRWRPGDFFIEHGIELRLGEAVATIDRDARLVRDAEGHEIHWDKLVLATGSYPFVPPIPGNDLAGCFVYRTLDDLDRIAAHAAAAKSGVVIGGGLLGLEAANALKQLGLETQVVEFAPNLMAVQLDNGGAAMLREKIVALGVGVHTSKATTAIVREADGLRLNFADGGALRTDMVVFSAGIRPQDALARGCALQVGERGGIHIDGQCRTSDPDVLAIGECALWDNKIYGLVAPGYQMARIAAATLAGEDACFSGADMSTKLKAAGGRRGLVWRCAGAHAGLSELSMDRRSAADLQKISSSVRTAKPCLAACWWGMPATMPRCCR